MVCFTCGHVIVHGRRGGLKSNPLSAPVWFRTMVRRGSYVFYFWVLAFVRHLGCANTTHDN